MAFGGGRVPLRVQCVDACGMGHGDSRPPVSGLYCVLSMQLVSDSRLPTSQAQCEPDAHRSRSVPMRGRVCLRPLMPRGATRPLAAAQDARATVRTSVERVRTSHAPRCSRVELDRIGRRHLVGADHVRGTRRWRLMGRSLHWYCRLWLCRSGRGWLLAAGLEEGAQLRL